MLGRHDHTPQMTGLAKRLRERSTDAEKKLWALLRCKQLQGFRFRRQHPIAGYVVDFVCLKKNLVVELDGGQHTEPARMAYDAARTERLEQLGLSVLRVPDDVMMKDPNAVLRSILRELSQVRPSP
jgi:very-short-patch-repair endonuclease